MSNGDDAPGDDDGSDPADAADGDDPEPEPAEPETFEQRLDEAAEMVEAAETEADLDETDATLDGIETDLEEAVFPVELEEESENEEEDEEDERENPRDGLEDTLSDLRDDVEQQRGPYLEDVTDVLGDAVTTVESSEWTREGETAVVEAVEQFLGSANETLDESFALEATEPAGIATELGEVRDAIRETGLHPDDDAAAIDALLGAANDLTADLDDAQVWGDLEIREQLRREGFYDVLTPENRKDFPPEWNAIKIYEKQGEVEPILGALEKLDSEFMQDNILDALEHVAPGAAYDAVHGLAQRRNKQPVRILGRIGDERACDTLHDFLGGGDVELEKTSLRALGAIGSQESTEPVAQRLAADNPEVRSAAARALGLIGDTRAIDPLGDLLAEDDDDSVRASAAWALNQIGTERALETAAAYADDRAYIVQVEAEKATSPSATGT
jgi:hypothetical protein